MKRRIAAVAAALALVVACSSCSGSVRVRDLALPDGLDPEPGTAIPQMTINAGWSPIGDGLIPVIGERKGYFADAGIDFTRPNGLKTDLLSSMTPLLNDQVELGATYMPLLTPQMGTVQSVTTFALPTASHVVRILAPQGKYDTLSELMSRGVPFAEAGRRVMEQLRGKKLMLYTGVDPQFYNMALGLAGMTLDDVETSYMGDPDMVTAAQSGKGDFASPNGAVQVSQLQQSGWEPLITITDIFENMPAESLNMANSYTGFVTTKQFANEHYNTLLRFTSVLFRISRDLQQDPVAACGVYVDYVNSYTGSDMTAEDCSKLYTDGLYELIDFDSYQAVSGPAVEGSDDTDYLTETQAQIERLEDNHVLDPASHHQAEEISIAHRVYADLRAYRDQAAELIETAPAGELRTEAEELFDEFNYLDAYRLAKAANEEGAA